MPRESATAGNAGDSVIYAMLWFLVGVTILIFGTIFFSGNDTKMDSITKELESWSVSNPASFYSHNDVFSLNDFLEESDSKINIRTDYNIKRVSTTNHDVLCFIEAKNETKMEAYSYQQKEWVDTIVCDS